MRLLRTVLSNPQLARLELAWATSALGNWAFSILLALYAYRHGGAPAVSAAILIRMLPAGLASPFAALLVDRHARRTVLLTSAAVRCGALLAAAAAAAASAPLGVVLALAAAYTVAHTAHRPAQGALMPQVARTPAELAAANVCWSALDYAGFLLGGLLAGAAAALGGFPVGFAACAGALGLTVVATAGLTTADRPPAPVVAPRAITELLDGARTVLAHAELRVLVTVFTANAVVQGVVDVLLVVASIELLGLGDSGAGWLNAAWGVGGTAGAGVALALLPRGRVTGGLVAGLVLAGVGCALVGAWGRPVPACALLVLMGVGFALVESALLTLTQRLAPADVLGRVFGVQETLEVAALGVGSVTAAALVDLVGVQSALVVAGLALPVAALVAARGLSESVTTVPICAETFDLVRRLALFAALPVAEHERLALAARTCRYAGGEPILVQGEPGDRFHLIADGVVEVRVDGRPRRRQGPGEAFGEIALLRGVRRTASVSAVGPVTTLAIDRPAFLAALGAHAGAAGVGDGLVREHLAGDVLAAARPAAAARRTAAVGAPGSGAPGAAEDRLTAAAVWQG